MNINWQVRLKNPWFWISSISALLLAIQALLKIFGVELDLGELGNNIKTFVNYVFGFLTAAGIINDPTTAGITDSSQAMTYTEPKDY